jgi:beta-barrel assembly-enhancing protease
MPPYVGAYEPQSVDERGLWMEADEYERRLGNSPLLLKDAALNAYVRDVLCKAVGNDRCQSVRIYILEVPAFNASMMPNGAMSIWTGLLLRTRNEAELAGVLAHEFAHFELRHSLRGYQQRRSASDVAAWASVLGNLANTNTTDLQFALLGSTFRFSRQQEEAADSLSLQYIAASPYNVAAPSELWQHIMAESDATAAGRKQRANQRYTSGFFDTHPTNLRRASTLAELAKRFGSNGEHAGERLRSALDQHMKTFLAAQIGLNDFGGTEYLLQQLAGADGWSGDLLYARGELYRRRGNPRDLVTAAQFYSNAISSGYEGPEVHRNLGLALIRSGNASEGKMSLREYMRLLPNASDASVIQTLIGN